MMKRNIKEAKWYCQRYEVVNVIGEKGVTSESEKLDNFFNFYELPLLNWEQRR